MLSRTIQFLMLAWILYLFGCSSYQAKAIPLSPPSKYPVNYVAKGGLEIGARFLSNAEDNKKYFGANLTRADLLPIELVFWNPTSAPTYWIDGMQVFAVDTDGNYWKVLDPGEVTDRIFDGGIAKEYAKNIGIGTGTGGAVGAAVGTALGAATGSNLGTGAATGAVLGGFSGGVAGGLKGPNREKKRKIAEDIERKTFSLLEVAPGYKISKFIFFPSGRYKYIEMQIHDSIGLIQKVYISTSIPRD